MREIGSEFEWSPPGERKLQLPDGVVFTLSGRTALKVALDDIGCRAGRALLPDWCCAAMIAPFRAAGMTVDFYPADSAEAPYIPGDCTVLLRCGYFGYADSWTWDTPEDFRSRGGVVIEDVTHSLLSDLPAHPGSDYLVASLRKWGPLLCGGFCRKTEGTLTPPGSAAPPAGFLDLRREAMELKADYLQSGDPALKARFRALFHRSGEWLGQHWQGVSMGVEALDQLTRWDVEEMRRRRRENARFLHGRLAGFDQVRPLYALRPGDCPLFVPVTVPAGGRDAVQRRLAEQGIYCPAHWPRPEQSCRCSLYDTELSLVCDQRYDLGHMARILEVIEG